MDRSKQKLGPSRKLMSRYDNFLTCHGLHPFGQGTAELQEEKREDKDADLQFDQHPGGSRLSPKIRSGLRGPQEHRKENVLGGMM